MIWFRFHVLTKPLPYSSLSVLWSFWSPTPLHYHPYQPGVPGTTALSQTPVPEGTAISEVTDALSCSILGLILLPGPCSGYICGFLWLWTLSHRQAPPFLRIFENRVKYNCLWSVSWSLVLHSKHFSPDCPVCFWFLIESTVEKTHCLWAFVRKVGQDFIDQEDSL